MLIDCDTCCARGRNCGDCVVTLFLRASDTADDVTEVEATALAALSGGGLLPPLRLVPAYRDRGGAPAAGAGAA